MSDPAPTSRPFPELDAVVTGDNLPTAPVQTKPVLRPAKKFPTHKQLMRSWVAFGLVGGLVVAILLVIVAWIVGKPSSELRDVFPFVSLLGTLTGTAVGYYFGGRKGSG